MIQRIKTHNLLNGIKFSIAEFIFIPLVISPFAIYYIAHAQAGYALVSVGIILNCLTIPALGLRQLRNNEKDIGLRAFTDKDERDRIGKEHPHLLLDTLLINVTSLLPFVLFVIVAYESRTSYKEGKP